MSKRLPVVGTRFIYYPAPAISLDEAFRRRQTRVEDWEGVVVRTYDAWAGDPTIDYFRVDTGELQTFTLEWWWMMKCGGWADRIVVHSVPEIG
jgi:hypothetical protein